MLLFILLKHLFCLFFFYSTEMKHRNTNKVTIFDDFNSDNTKSKKINEARLSDKCPKLFKKENNPGQSSILLPFKKVLAGEFILPISVHSYVHNTYSSKTPAEIVEELEVLFDKLTDFCSNDSDFVKLLDFSLALSDCFGHVLFACESSELHIKLAGIYERVKNLTSAHLLFVKNMSLIKNKSAFVPSFSDFSDYNVGQIRMCEL